MHMTEKQIDWAASHDWFYASSFEGAVIVVDTEGPVDLLKTFTDFQKLKEWAGY